MPENLFDLKHAALAARVTEILKAQDGRFSVVRYIPDETRDSVGSVADQKRIMGDPARYAEVLYAGDAEPSSPRNAARRVITPTETFDIGVWWEHDTRARGRGEAAFVAALKGPQGLVTTLYSEATLRLGPGRSARLGDPEQIAFFDVALRSGAVAFHARLSLTLT